MQEGLLWFDADPKRDLADKVARAADRYHFKFGVRPDVCYVHTSALDNGPVQLNGVRLVPADNVLRHHFWIGVEEPSRASGNGRLIACRWCGQGGVEVCLNCAEAEALARAHLDKLGRLTDENLRPAMGRYVESKIEEAE